MEHSIAYNVGFHLPHVLLFLGVWYGLMSNDDHPLIRFALSAGLPLIMIWSATQH